MRSGFLNASSSADSPSSSSLDKGCRNKRKSRTDQQRQLSAVSSLACIPMGESIKNGMISSDGNLSISDAKDPQNIDPSPCTAGCCSYAHHMMLSNHFSHPKNHTGLTNMPSMDCRLQPGDCSTGLQHDEHTAILDSDWDRFLEAQLEEILMSMLDVVYKDAIKKIASCNFSHEDALNAVLRNGRWNGQDALASLIESSLAWLQNKEVRVASSTPDFIDLKQLESYVLTEMICMLRKVRPYMSKGDAMWFLLMSDLNVFLACTSEEDTMLLSSNDKDGVVSNVHLQPTPSNLDSLPSNAPPSNNVASIPLSEYIVQTPASSISSQTLSSSLCHNNTPSAFSTPSFSSSHVGKVSVSTRKATSKLSISSNSGRFPVTTSTNNEPVNLSQQNTLHNPSVGNSYKLSLPYIPTLEEHSANLGLYVQQCNNKLEYAEKLQTWQPDHMVPSVSASDTSRQTMQMAAFPQCSDASSNSRCSMLSVQTTSLRHDSNKARAFNNVCPNVALQLGSKQPLQTDLHIGRLLPTVSGFQDSSCDNLMKSNASTIEGILVASGVDLSLATSSFPIDSVAKEGAGNSHMDSNKEIASSQTDHSLSASQVQGCIDPNAEERKTVMLWQLVDRVQYIETQLQEWTDWGQQKVMQAARRLTKDSSELKALRQERDEYIRLKKEKQALEESTMKKLAEMENALRKAVSQVDRANSTAWRLEAENSEVRAEMEAAKLAAMVSVSECQEATKRENKSTKKSQGWEKQKLKLQEDIFDGKRNLSYLLGQHSQAKDRLCQTEARWRQEKTAKEEALRQAGTEKMAREQLERSAKRRVEALQENCEAECQRHRDEVKKLEQEIAKVKVSLGLQPSPLSWEMVSGHSEKNLKQMHSKLLLEIADLQKKPQADVHRDRECVMCLSEEMSVVFLPCAHQIVCAKCNELHQKQGLRECPSCRTPIQRRIRVYGVQS